MRIQQDKIIRLEEFVKMAEEADFLIEIFSAKEIREYHHPANLRSLAARWLLKEMFQQLTYNKLEFNGIEIINNALGKPEICFSESNSRIIKKNGVLNYDCSISHSRSLIAAFLVLEKS